ncbi:hypothetical protein [Streptomyces sp. HNM0574]|uniref:hypothetical protein n=1 Tax=Streptomyces sp. HNM0574 TaxID=2714954 RepID=UPI00146D878F|nr:hypothetical protein [Streptomyces sp. HNM0574]NLU68036.1 hypothetical protein [Streptomyces sp. HNM0574]
MSLEGVVAVTTAVTALITVPATLLAAHWTSRSTGRAADATVLAGNGQSTAVLQAACLQARAEREQALESLLRTVCTEFLRAADLFARAVDELPDLPHEHRRGLLTERAGGVAEALSRLELLGLPAVTARAQSLSAQCRRLEKVAMKRAVLRSALDRLEASWCPRNAEECEDPHHSSAYVAWDLLTRWGQMEAEERWEELELLEFVLEDSRALNAVQVEQVLDAVNCVAAWNELIGGWARDPLMERFDAVRAEYVAATHDSLHRLAERSSAAAAA